jgi:hypothetical protein
MNKQINFEDIIYVLNVRIRMIKDLFHLDIDFSLFYSQTIEDMEFISSTLGILTEKFLKNQKFIDRETDAESLLDAEWNFSQLLNEFSNNYSLYSFINFSETQALIARFKKESLTRKKQIEESCSPDESFITETVVTHMELSDLLGSA